MQFGSTWDTSFNRIVENCNKFDNNFCIPQLKVEIRTHAKTIGMCRQQYNMSNTDELLKLFDKYEPISSIIVWQELKIMENTTTRKYKQSVYFGQINVNKRQGLGVMLYANGRVYQGNWQDNYKHGNGYEKFPNGALYSGSYVKGKPQGYGTYSWQNGQTYEGEWLDGMKNGSGIWRGPTGDSYIGQWKNGQANGYGVHTWINGDRYQGEFKDCLKHGEGVQKFANGDSYKGNYVMGKPQGFGEYFWAIGSYFKGHFQNGLRNGKGIWKRQAGNSDKYQGQYKDDKKQGYGIFTWQNGNTYKGNYINDLRNGYGQMYWSNGCTYKGHWINNQQIQINNLECNFDQQKQTHQPNIESDLYERQNKQITEKRKMRIKLIDRSRNKQHVCDNQGQFQLMNNAEIVNPAKRFRIQQNTYRKQKRVSSQKSSRSYIQRSSQNNYIKESQNKFVRKYSVGSRCLANKKIKQGSSDSKMMSSTFYLYKIHNKSPGLDENSTKVKPRQVKTSGAMRQRAVQQQIKYFTKNRMNPENI